MPFYIAPFPGQTYPPQHARNEDIRAWIGHGKLVERKLSSNDKSYFAVEAGKLPIEAAGTFILPLTNGLHTTLRVVPGTPSKTGDYRGKSSKHRCYAECPDCYQYVPAGRTHQHKCKGK